MKMVYVAGPYRGPNAFAIGAGSVMERDRALEMSIPLFEDLEKLCDWYARTPERRSA